MDPKRAVEILRWQAETPIGHPQMAEYDVMESEANLLGAIAIEWCEARCAFQDASISPTRPVQPPDQLPLRYVALIRERVARRAYLAAAHPEKKP